MNKSELKLITENLIETFEIAGKESINIYKKGLVINIKEDNSPVSNGDLKVNELICNKIKDLTPNIPIISEETVDLKKKNQFKIFWLIDPIDGTKEYIAGKDEYTLNAALIINQKPVIGLVGAPKKNQLFFSFGLGDSFLKEDGKIKKICCSKMTPKDKIIALTSISKQSEIVLNKLKEYKVTSMVQWQARINFAQLLKRFDIYAAREEL